MTRKVLDTDYYPLRRLHFYGYESDSTDSRENLSFGIPVISDDKVHDKVHDEVHGSVYNLHDATFDVLTRDVTLQVDNAGPHQAVLHAPVPLLLEVFTTQRSMFSRRDVIGRFDVQDNDGTVGYDNYLAGTGEF